MGIYYYCNICNEELVDVLPCPQCGPELSKCYNRIFASRYSHSKGPCETCIRKGHTSNYSLSDAVRDTVDDLDLNLGQGPSVPSLQAPSAHSIPSGGQSRGSGSTADMALFPQPAHTKLQWEVTTQEMMRQAMGAKHLPPNPSSDSYSSTARPTEPSSGTSGKKRDRSPSPNGKGESSRKKGGSGKSATGGKK